MSTSARDLALKIMRCPIVARVGEPDGYQLGCYEVVTGPGGFQRSGWGPTPWVGHLTEAPVLFISSNPAGTDAASEEELARRWADDEVLDMTEGGLDRTLEGGIGEGTKPLRPGGTRGRAVRYWSWALHRTRELLGDGVRSGHDYALTEVVHCSSRQENGVWAAARTCATLYLQRVLEASPAKVIVIVGSVAKDAVNENLKLTIGGAFEGPVTLLGRERILLALPHPNSFSKHRTLTTCLSEDQLEKARAFLHAS